MMVLFIFSVMLWVKIFDSSDSCVSLLFIGRPMGRVRISIIVSVIRIVLQSLTDFSFFFILLTIASLNKRCLANLVRRRSPKRVVSDDLTLAN